MSAIKPLSAMSYPFDFLRLPLHGAVDKRMNLPKATGSGTGWANGDTVYASTTTGVVIATGDNSTGIAIGTGVGYVSDDDASAVVAVSGNNALALYELQRDGVRTEGLLHVAGTVTNVWSAHPGYFTPAGDSSISLNSTDFSELLAMDSSMSSVAVFYHVNRTTKQNADAMIMQCGNVAKGSPGGVNIQSRTAGLHEFEVWPTEASAAGIGTVTTKAWAADEENWWCHFADMSRSVVESSRDADASTPGQGSNSPNAIKPMADAGRAFNGNLGGLFGFTLFSGTNSGGAANAFINNTAGDEHFSDFFIARNVFDIDSLIAAFADYRYQYYEKRLRRVAT